MMFATVVLPKDGARYDCTWRDDDGRCRKPCTRGLASVELVDEVIARATRAGQDIYLYRALCPEHIEAARRVIEQ